MKQISVIIPNYLEKKKLKRCIESIYFREKILIEIIVVNDGKKIEVSANTQLPVKYIHLKKNRGAAFARNVGLAAAKYEWVLFLDSDCSLVTPVDHIHNQFTIFQNKDVQVGALGGKLIFPRSYLAQVISLSDSLDCLNGDSPEYRFFLSTGLFFIGKKTILKVNGFKSEFRRGQDRELCYRLADKGYKFMFDPSIRFMHDHSDSGFIKHLKKEYSNGRQLGLALELKYSKYYNLGFLNMYSSIWVYPLLIIPLSAFLTFKMLMLTKEYRSRAILALPLVFIFKVSYRVGTYTRLLQNHF
ncbi:MAG: glycosyltransferase family A protein [Nanoarchaeota archaeon]